MESAIKAASKWFISELFSDLSFGFKVALELELFPFAKSWIYGHSHFVYVWRVYKVASVCVSLCFEAIIKGKFDLLPHLKGLLQWFLRLLKVIIIPPKGVLLLFVIPLSLPMFGNQIDHLYLLFYLLTLMGIFMIWTASIAESDVEDLVSLAFYLFLWLQWLFDFCLYS